MTIEIPDDLVISLQQIAALRQTSVEDMAVESQRSLLATVDSPQGLLRALRQLPHPSAGAVDELEAAISGGQLPVSDHRVFVD